MWLTNISAIYCSWLETSLQNRPVWLCPSFISFSELKNRFTCCKIMHCNNKERSCVEKSQKPVVMCFWAESFLQHKILHLLLDFISVLTVTRCHRAMWVKLHFWLVILSISFESLSHTNYPEWDIFSGTRHDGAYCLVRPLTSRSCPIHYSLIVQPFDTISNVLCLLLASLNRD